MTRMGLISNKSLEREVLNLYLLNLVLLNNFKNYFPGKVERNLFLTPTVEHIYIETFLDVTAWISKVGPLALTLLQFCHFTHSAFSSFSLPPRFFSPAPDSTFHVSPILCECRETSFIVL